jgi:hypothetical protein
MNQIDNPRPTPPPVRPGRAATGLAAAIVALGVLFITVVAAPSPRTQPRPTADLSPEAFTGIGPFVAPSLSAAPAMATTSNPTAPSPSPISLASPSLVVDANHVATRVRVPDLGIDLPVVAPPRDRSAYPKCGVAMYLAELHQPGGDGATYLYAHAREGMFLPIYERAIQRRHGGPKSMVGLSVEVFTSDNLRYLYAIEQVLLHQTTLGEAARTRTSELWLQTSEGPRGTPGKTQVRSLPVGVEAATQRDAHPTAKPFTCG